MKHTLPLLLVLCVLASCASVDSTGDLKYHADAKANYDAGQEALKSGRNLDAIKFFDHVRYKFPYSSQAALADLAVADTHFAREKYVEAAEAYRNFIKLHPLHQQADYAYFRIAMAHYKDMPGDFILFPPSAEKDQTAVLSARTAFEDFLKLYPQSNLVPEAQKYLNEVLSRLARHEMAIADFYLHRERWNAAVGRLSRVLNEYPASGLEGEATIKLARTYLKLDQKDKARETLQRLLDKYPHDPHRAQAETMLKSLT